MEDRGVGRDPESDAVDIDGSRFLGMRPRDGRGTGGAAAEPSLGERVERNGLAVFALLAYAVTWTLLVSGYLALRAGLLSEDAPLIGLLAQVAAAGPLVAAVTVLLLSRGRAGLAALGRSLVRWRVGLAWYLFVFLGVPLSMLVSMSVLHGPGVLSALGEASPSLLVRFPLLVFGVAVFTGLAEEPGWRGYAQPRANERFAPLAAAFVVSVMWSLWHLPNALFAAEGLGAQAAHVVATVVNGFVQAWVFNSTGGSVWIAMLLHGSMNATAGTLLQALESAGEAPTAAGYYAVSAVTFGVMMTVVAIATRGRLGAPVEVELSARRS